MDELQGIARFRFHEGKVDEFKRLSAICLEIVRAEDTGTLQYDTYFNDDESECIVLERFRDSRALIEHSGHLAHLMEAIIATGDVHGELLGDPSAELKANFADDGPVQLFTRYQSLEPTRADGSSTDASEDGAPPARLLRDGTTPDASPE
jgi:quinol monooxygenase YgiN